MSSSVHPEARRVIIPSMADTGEHPSTVQATERGVPAGAALGGDDFRRMLAAASAWLDQHADAIDAINVFPVPDGDTGRNMAQTLRAAWRPSATSRARASATSCAPPPTGRCWGRGATQASSSRSGCAAWRRASRAAGGEHGRAGGGAGARLDRALRRDRGAARRDDPIRHAGRGRLRAEPGRLHTARGAARGRREGGGRRRADAGADAAAGRGGRRRLRRAGTGRRAGRIRARPAQGRPARRPPPISDRSARSGSSARRP